VTVGLNAVIVAVTEEVPRILTVEHASAPGAAALPFGPLDPIAHRTLELGLRGWVREQTGLELGYVEQLYTFGDRFRDPRERAGRPRVISVAYLALVREQEAVAGADAAWRNIYDFFPWEDWRTGCPPVIGRQIVPRLDQWITAADAPDLARTRRERADIAFARAGSAWDEQRVLDRYELLYEAGLAGESPRDRRERPDGGPPPDLGEPMALDHRRILASALGRLRGKLEYRPVVFELLPATFTLLQLQQVVEALAGTPLHKQNFRRLVDRGGLVEGTGELERVTGGRPAERFRFRREVLRERPAPGVPLPATRR
jgi:hypothetical protein